MANVDYLHHSVCPVFIALGSNLANPEAQVLKAFDELAKLRSSRLVMRSSLYRSAPVGRLDQPDFINAVAQMETALSPHVLLEALLDVEHAPRTSTGIPRWSANPGFGPPYLRRSPVHRFRADSAAS